MFRGEQRTDNPAPPRRNLFTADRSESEQNSQDRHLPSTMSIPSGSKLEQPDQADSSPPAPDVPLAGLPLVADHQRTVVSSRPDKDSSSPSASQTADTELLNPSEALFSSDGTESIPGTVRLDHFEIRRRIGSGGMGRVFLAEDLDLRRPVALKVLNPGSTSDSALLARFQNEARSAALLRHDNIAQVYYTGESQGVHFIACEFIAGRTIRELIEEYETLPADLVVNYAIQATLALNHMSSSGVVHRDIKPSNIIVSNDGRVKIVDLGLARRDSPDSVCDITVAGSTLGTFDYLSPEQARDPREADARSDIYSLGCTLYHMLTGQPPYPEGTALQKLLDHQGKQAPDPARINSKVPGDLAEIVLRMMKTDPNDRYQSPGELLSDLIEVATDMGLQGVPADGIVWQQVEEPAVRRLTGAMVLLAAVIVFCLTGITMHLMPGETTPARLPVVPETSDRNPSLTRPVAEGPLSGDPDETAAAGSTGIINTSPLSPDPPPARKPYIVHTTDGQQLEYDTLTDALFRTPLPVDIELTFTGPAPVPVRLIPRLEHQTVRMYASEGARPVLQYRGNPEDADATNMFTLANSRLELEGIDLRLTPEGTTPDSVWTMFDCSGSSSLSLIDCTIDVQGSEGVSAEICRLKESTTDTSIRHSTTIDCRNVLVRGAADMFRIAALTNTQISLQNCGFGIEGHLINNTGRSSMAAPGTIDVQLEQVTCVLGAPLIRIFEEEVLTGRHSISRIQVISRAGVYCSTQDQGVLVDSQATVMVDDQRSLLTWNGDTNLFSRFEDFWTLSDTASGEEGSQVYSFTEWKDYWTRRPAAAEAGSRTFDWEDAAWLVKEPDPEQSSVLLGLKRDWLELDRGRFHGADPLPLYQDHKVPGVTSRQLPRFPRPRSR